MKKLLGVPPRVDLENNNLDVEIEYVDNDDQILTGKVKQ